MSSKSHIVNPKTGRKIKIGGTTHYALVQENILDKSTLTLDKISIFKDSRQKMPEISIETFKNSTHWTNAKQIADAIGVSVFMLLDYFSNVFDKFKVCKINDNVRVIFPEKEFFIQEVVYDFIQDYSKKHKLDYNYWNQ